MKLSKAQISALEILQKYPNETVMHTGWITGGHGIKFVMKTIYALSDRGLISYGKITESGKNFKINK